MHSLTQHQVKEVYSFGQDARGGMMSPNYNAGQRNHIARGGMMSPNHNAGQQNHIASRVWVGCVRTHRSKNREQ